MLKQIKNPIIVLKKKILSGKLAEFLNGPANFFKTFSEPKIGPVNFFLLLAGSLIDLAKNWPSQNFKKFGWAKKWLRLAQPNGLFPNTNILLWISQFSII